jgi:hypothetical protein
MEFLDFVHHPVVWKNTFQKLDLFPSSAEREGGFQWWRAAISNRQICPFIWWKHIHFSKMLCSFRTLGDRQGPETQKSLVIIMVSSLSYSSKKPFSMTSPYQNSVYIACLAATARHPSECNLTDFALLITPAGAQPDIQFRSTIHYTEFIFPQSCSMLHKYTREINNTCSIKIWISLVITFTLLVVFVFCE